MAGNQPFAKRLKEARLRKAERMKADGNGGMSQERLGIEAGIEEASASARMNQYEKGVHAPDISMSVRLAAILDVPLAYLYCVEDDLAELLLQAYLLQKSKRNAVIQYAIELKQSTTD